MVVRRSLTTLKTVMAGVILEAFPATSRVAVAAFNEVIAPPLRSCRLVVENMVVKVRAVGGNVAASEHEEKHDLT